MKSLSLLSKYRTELMGVAAIWIALFHFFWQNISQVTPLQGILSYGNMGVEIFLLLSGLGLFFSYSKHPDKKAFWRKRFFRVVVPAYIISLPFWIGKSLLKHFSLKTFFLKFSGLAIFLDGERTTWYITMILIMYILYPFIFDLQKRRRNFIPIAVVATVILNIVLLFLAPDFYKKIEIMLSRVPIFLIGSLLGEKIKNRRTKTSALFLPIYILLSFCLAAMSPLGSTWLHCQLLIRLSYGGISIIVTHVFALILDYIKNFNFHNILSIFGAISLEFYLIHVQFSEIIRGANFFQVAGIGATVYVSIIAFLLAALFSWLFHIIYERCLARPRKT